MEFLVDQRGKSREETRSSQKRSRNSGGRKEERLFD